jgi:MFS family permease
VDFPRFRGHFSAWVERPVTLSPLVLALALHPNTPYAPAIFVSFLLLGVGGGMSFMTLMGVALSDVAPADAGIASGLINVSLQIGSAIGVAVLGTLAAARTKALQHHGVLAHAAMAGGFRRAFWVLTIAVAAGLAFGIRYLWAVPRRASRGDLKARRDPASFLTLGKRGVRGTVR